MGLDTTTYSDHEEVLHPPHIQICRFSRSHRDHMSDWLFNLAHRTPGAMLWLGFLRRKAGPPSMPNYTKT